MSALHEAVKHIQFSADNETDIKWGDDAAAELAALNERIAELEKAAEKSLEWLHHYPSHENIEEQMVVNVTRARRILEKVLKVAEFTDSAMKLLEGVPDLQENNNG